MTKITRKIINEMTYEIVGCAITVHKELGPGLLESVYEHCMCEELKDKGFYIKRQQSVPIIYRGKILDCELRYDILVNDLIIVELKAVEIMIPLFKAQLLTYLKLLEKPKGLLINFNCENIISQMVPMVTPAFAELPEF